MGASRSSDNAIRTLASNPSLSSRAAELCMSASWWQDVSSARRRLTFVTSAREKNAFPPSLQQKSLP